MKRIIANLFTRTHVENRLARRLKGSVVNLAMGESSGFSFLSVAIDRSQVRGEFLPDRLSGRRSLVLDPREAGTQGTLTRSGDLLPDGVSVTQIERAQERSKCESLERERAEHDRERGQHDQVAERKSRG